MNQVRRNISLAVAAACAALSAPVAAQQISLKLHHFLGPKSPAHAQMLVPWAERVAKASGGKVKIEVFPSMALGGKPPQLINQARDGVVDLIWTVNGYTANLFPRSEVFELPFVHTNSAVATNLAMRAMYDKYLKAEYTGVHPLFLHVHAGQAIHMVDKEVRKPDDLKGLKMRIPTRTGAWIIEALGASPVGMPVPDLPQALSKKVVDGAFIPWEIIPPLKIQDVTDYQIEGPNRMRFGTTTFQVSMNQARWDKLPADVKQAFTSQSGEAWVREVGEIWTKSEDFGIGLATKAGNKHIVLSDAELAAFREKLEPVVKRWIDDVSKQGIDGGALVSAARANIAKYTK
jgi:TRAP-type C4-dicarboxylate transport system substrate-binding protein